MEERYKTGEVWGIPFEFDTAALVDVDNVELIYGLSHLEDPDYPQEEKNPLEFFTLFHACFGREQWRNVKKSLKAMGKTTFADSMEFFFEAMQAAGRSEGAELKN